MNYLAAFGPCLATVISQQRGRSTCVTPLLVIKPTKITMAPKSLNQQLTSIIIEGIDGKKLDCKIKGLLVVEDLSGVMQKEHKPTLLGHGKLRGSANNFATVEMWWQGRSLL